MVHQRDPRSGTSMGLLREGEFPRCEFQRVLAIIEGGFMHVEINSWQSPGDFTGSTWIAGSRGTEDFFRKTSFKEP